MEQPVKLRDGSAVVLRPIRADDKDGLREGFERLSPESRYRRFLSARGQFTDAELRFLTEVDHHDHEALVAVEPGAGRGVGIARYVRSAGAERSAEAAIAVADDWQARGVGTALLEALAGRARTEGVAEFDAIVLWSNLPRIKALFGRLGGTPRVRDAGAGTAELRVALARDGAGPHLRHCLKAAAAGELEIEPRRGAARDARPDVDDVSAMSFPASDPPATWTWDPPGPYIANSR